MYSCTHFARDAAAAHKSAANLSVSVSFCLCVVRVCAYICLCIEVYGLSACARALSLSFAVAVCAFCAIELKSLDPNIKCTRWVRRCLVVVVIIVGL